MFSHIYTQKRMNRMALSAPVISDKLFTLKLALDESEMLPILNSLFTKRLDTDIEARKIDIEIMRRRNKRCVIRYRVEAFDGQNQAPIDLRIIGKVFKQNRGERVFEMMRQLWESGFSRDAGDGLSIPEPLDFSTPLCMLFQEEVPGRPLKNLIKESPDPEHLKLLARVIAKLHQCPIIPNTPMTIQDHLLRCHPRYPTLALALPESETRIDYVIRKAEQAETLFGAVQHTPIHGDFHLGQVHLEDDRIWLIDFDAISYADPAADLGNLLVFMKAKTKKNPQVQNLIEAFLGEYFSIMDRSIADRIPIYEGLTHLRRACKCLRLQEEGWQRKATRMIEKSVACIDAVGIRRPPDSNHEMNGRNGSL